MELRSALDLLKKRISDIMQLGTDYEGQLQIDYLDISDSTFTQNREDKPTYVYDTFIDDYS